MAAKVRLLITLLTHAGMAAPSCRLSYVWDVAPPVPGAGMRDNGPYVKFLYGTATTADTPGYCLHAVNGDLVTVMFAWSSNSAADGVIGVLPAGLRPLNRAVGVAAVMGLSTFAQLTVNEDGRIMINSSTKSNYWAGSMTFQAAS